MANQIVKDFYEMIDENSRMSENPLEYLRCKEIITRFLSKNPIRILDLGGATGAFSFWLADKGHIVDLVDYTPKHVETAIRLNESAEFKLNSIKTGDARKLDCDSNTFDIVLLMGPLYHLVARKDRIDALNECWRVLKQGGALICVGISRYASTLDGFVGGFAADKDFVEILTRDLETGFHQDTSKAKKYFTDSYFHSPEELVGEIDQSLLQFEELIAVESIGYVIPGLKDKIQNRVFLEDLLSTIRLIEKNRDIMGISVHFMGIGRKT